jgi:pimeloyl-ACP methyl ester carboxylesterase
MMCDARLFGPQLNAFASDRSVGVSDLIGENTIAGLAEKVLLDAPEKFALAGLSMGGIVAMEMVRQQPMRVSALALLDTNPLAEAETTKHQRRRQIELACAGRLFDVMRDEMKPNYLANGPERQNVLDLCMEMAMDLGAEVFCQQSAALRDRIDQSDTLRGFDRPTLVMCGREDTLCPISRHEYMYELLPHATLSIIDEAGHLPTLVQPVATTNLLLNWLKDADNG